MAVSSSRGQLEWREVEGGELPSPRWGPRVTSVDEILFLAGGSDGDNYPTSILSWDPVAESWQPAGHLAVARDFPAAVAVPKSVVGVC